MISQLGEKVRLSGKDAAPNESSRIDVVVALLRP
jgi:hypothetical protein